MAPKSPKRQPAANLLGGWGKPAICSTLSCGDTLMPINLTLQIYRLIYYTLTDILFLTTHASMQSYQLLVFTDVFHILTV